MTEQKKALGKGLGSLIPSVPKPQNGPRIYFECPVADIITNPHQPRKLFPKEALSELAASIEQKGIIQPLVVRAIGGGKYEIIAGERRYRAAKLAGLETIPVVVKDADASGTLELALIENIQRQDLNPIEEALAYKELLSRHQYTQDELARHLGKDRSSIANALRLLKLPDKIRDYVINNKISMGHARALLALESKELQLQVADDIIQNNLSVREVEILTKKLKEQDVNNIRRLPVQDKNKTTSSGDYAHFTRQLEAALRRKVRIKANGTKGEICIAFSTQEDLKAIVDQLLA